MHAAVRSYIYMTARLTEALRERSCQAYSSRLGAELRILLHTAAMRHSSRRHLPAQLPEIHQMQRRLQQPRQQRQQGVQGRSQLRSGGRRPFMQQSTCTVPVPGWRRPSCWLLA